MAQAVSHPVLGAQYCFPEEREFLVCEKLSLFGSGDSFSVSDNNGNSVFKVSSSLMSATDKLKLKDTQTGEVVAHIRKKLLGVGDSWVVETPAGAHVAIIKDPMFNILASLDVKLADRTTLEVEGGFLQKSFNIKRERLGFDPIIATVKKESKFAGTSAFIREHVLDKQSYYVRVEPGEDAALMVCIAVVIDEMYNEEQAKKEGAADN